jgi:SM-20-related protein
VRYLAAINPVPSIYCVRSFLERDECRKLAGEMDAGPLRAATLDEPGQGEVVVKHRRRAEYLATFSQTQAGVERKLAAMITNFAAHFSMGLSGMQPPQLLRYSNGCYFRPHKDRSDASGHGDDIRHRRITAVLFLNCQTRSPSDGGYCGGDLRLYQADDHPDPTLCITGQTGMLVAFESSVVHEVRPVTWGVRRTVAAWYCGAP